MTNLHRGYSCLIVKHGECALLRLCCMLCCRHLATLSVHWLGTETRRSGIYVAVRLWRSNLWHTTHEGASVSLINSVRRNNAVPAARQRDIATSDVLFYWLTSTSRRHCLFFFDFKLFCCAIIYVIVEFLGARLRRLAIETDVAITFVR